MRLRLRRRDPVLLAIAAWLLVWPAVHALLTRALDVSPWRMGGWAMYATPVPQTSDVVVAVRKCDAPRLTLAQPSGRPTALVWVHGHGQCASCGVNVEPCCQGDSEDPGPSEGPGPPERPHRDGERLPD